MNTDLIRIQSIAMDNARGGITISDARLPNTPIIFVNKGFCLMTGYTSAEVLGKNCRFLRGEHNGVKNIPSAIMNGETVQEEIVNYKKDGTPFWNKLSFTPVFNEEKELTHFIGIQEDVTVQKEKEALELKVANRELITKTTLLSEEKQRKEIGEELHDNVNQLLAATKLYLDIAMEQEDKRWEMLIKSKEMLMTAMEEIRKLSKKLTGPDTNKPLELTVSEIIGSMQAGVSFPIALDYDASVDSLLTESRKLAICRIIQEQLNNIIKHAKATAVLVNISQEGKIVQLSVKDNGVGFNPENIFAGIGLKNMKSRAEIEDGTFRIISTENNGCEIIVRFPAGSGTPFLSAISEQSFIADKSPNALCNFAGLPAYPVMVPVKSKLKMFTVTPRIRNEKKSVRVMG